MTTKRNQQKSTDIPRRLPPIVVVPDKSYIDDTGNVIPTDVILISDPGIYMKMQIALSVWDKEPKGIMPNDKP